jgi:dipeptidyl aminopeptidase/acylaminoacyl peptidase
MSNSIITNRENIIPNHFQKNMIKKMFDVSVFEKTIVEKIDYLSDNLNVKGYISYPNNIDNKYPVLLWNRGGYQDGGAIDELTSFLILASTAVWGYVVVASQYRGNMGGDDSEDWGGSDVNDALRMLDIAAELPFTDMSRVAIEGASRGGMTTYRAMAIDQRFKCAIVHAGISDLFEMEQHDKHFASIIEQYSKELTPDEKQTKLASMSGVYIAEKFNKNCPILLLHGTSDERVPITQTESMAKELKRLSHPHKYIPIEKGGHIALKDKSYKEIDIYRKEWLKKYL